MHFFLTLTEMNGPTADIWYLFIHLFFLTQLEVRSSEPHFQQVATVVYSFDLKKKQKKTDE